MKATRFEISLETGIYCPYCGDKISADHTLTIVCNHVLFIVLEDRFHHVDENSGYDQDPDLCGMTVDEFISVLDEPNIVRVNIFNSYLELGDGYIIFYSGGK